MKFKLYKYFIFLIVFTVFSQFSAFSQNTDAQLAFRYYQNKEFEKAATLYEKLYRQNGYKNNRDYYLRCLSELKEFDTAEKFLKKEIKKNANDFYLMIDLGMVYQQTNRFKDATAEFDKVVEIVKLNRNNINAAAAVFIGYRQYEYAEKVYLEGVKNTNYDYTMELGNLFYVQRDYPKMMSYYLDYLEENPQNLNVIQSRLQYVMTNDIDQSIDDIVETSVMDRIQKKPQVEVYSQLIIWQYTQTGRFRLALNQLFAIDKRNKKSENDILNYGIILFENLEYDLALEAFNYIMNKGTDNAYYSSAYVESLNVLYVKTLNQEKPSKDELTQLRNKLEESLKVLPRKETYKIIYAIINLDAFYLNNYDSAINLAVKSIEDNRFITEQTLTLKLLLADIYFLSENTWEAILTYAEVEKAATERPIGHEARFRKAKLAYYTGQFKWAQAQLDVLKASTSKLIANDAMELSMFISDNYNLDTTETTMQIFARADFYIFSKQYERAFAGLDSIVELYPNHGLIDDVLYRKGEIYQAIGNYEKASSYYNQVATTYYYDILGDNALFKYAVCQEKLRHFDTAQEAYLKLIKDYPGSIFTVEARKNLRRLSESK
ncbi:MAG TPA: tetratricopeptide repeat protein [Bacteroidales bacterium]|nr:tetratricopeptide repeat protein [Bacteroidales bacterium]HOR59949.1 tetratricopeptide repeat protein [Bacteroidales bacterium]HPL04399.1 tetratricopeptide repeat protein [Bacteroidales bacterium]